MHILLVEDEQRLAKAVKRVLEEEGHVADAVEDGADALIQATTGKYDLILLDVMLPGMNGYDIARRLRALGDTTPILMLTARDSVSDRVRGLDAGADDYERERALFIRGLVDSQPLRDCEEIELTAYETLPGPRRM